MDYYPYMNPEKLAECWKMPPCYLQTSREEILREHTLDFELMLTRANVFHKLRDLDGGGGHELSSWFTVLHPEWEEAEQILQEMIIFFSKQESGRTAGK